MGQTQHQKIYCQRTGNLTPRGQKISMISEESRDIYIDTEREGRSSIRNKTLARTPCRSAYSRYLFIHWFKAFSYKRLSF